MSNFEQCGVETGFKPTLRKFGHIFPKPGFHRIVLTGSCLRIQGYGIIPVLPKMHGLFH